MNDPSVWRKYARKATFIEMRPFVPGETLEGVSVNPEDIPPSTGDMIAKNPNNPKDQWLVSRDYFQENYETIPVS